MWLHAEVKSLADIPRYYGRTAPERTALISADQRRTFRELDRASNRVAAAILRTRIARSSHIAFLGRIRSNTSSFSSGQTRRPAPCCR